MVRFLPLREEGSDQRVLPKSSVGDCLSTEAVRGIETASGDGERMINKLWREMLLSPPEELREARAASPLKGPFSREKKGDSPQRNNPFRKEKGISFWSDEDLKGCPTGESSKKEFPLKRDDLVSSLAREVPPTSDRKCESPSRPRSSNKGRDGSGEERPKKTELHPKSSFWKQEGRIWPRHLLGRLMDHKRVIRGEVLGSLLDKEVDRGDLEESISLFLTSDFSQADEEKEPTAIRCRRIATGYYAERLMKEHSFRLSLVGGQPVLLDLTSPGAEEALRLLHEERKALHQLDQEREAWTLVYSQGKATVRKRDPLILRVQEDLDAEGEGPETPFIFGRISLRAGKGARAGSESFILSRTGLWKLQEELDEFALIVQEGHQPTAAFVFEWSPFEEGGGEGDGLIIDIQGNKEAEKGAAPVARRLKRALESLRPRSKEGSVGYQGSRVSFRLPAEGKVHEEYTQLVRDLPLHPVPYRVKVALDGTTVLIAQPAKEAWSEEGARELRSSERLFFAESNQGGKEETWVLLHSGARYFLAWEDVTKSKGEFLEEKLSSQELGPYLYRCSLEERGLIEAVKWSLESNLKTLREDLRLLKQSLQDD